LFSHDNLSDEFGTFLAISAGMILSYSQTKALIEAVLDAKPAQARATLRYELATLNSNEPQFYASVIKHESGLPLSSQQWFDFLSKIPTCVFREERPVMDKLSGSQREKLPPATIG
jgi:hypothetical protein